MIGLYVDPPAHAVVLSVDEKSQIQALDRTQQGLLIKKGRARHYLAEHKTRPEPFVWAANPEAIIAAAERGHQALDAIP